MKLGEQVVQELRKLKFPHFPLYEAIMTHALETNQPIFASDKFSLRYLELAEDDEWFANSLVANSCLEGYGSQQIWKFSNKLDNDLYAERVRKHALDESRHSTMFITILGLVFPGVLDSVDQETARKIDQMQPRFTQEKHPAIQKVTAEERLFELETINELIQVHITEIRALVLQYMVREAMKRHAPADNLPRLLRMSDSLIADEARHIQYSAEIFENYAVQNKDMFFEMFEARLHDFNELTKEELAREELEL